MRTCFPLSRMETTGQRQCRAAEWGHHVVVEVGTAVKAVAALMMAVEGIEEEAVAIVDNL